MIYQFDPFELDLAKAELRTNGRPQALEPQVFALLAFLVEHRERLVSKDEIFEKVWDGRIVTDSALASRVKSARKVLGDDGKSQRFIKTIHGQGFRFVAEVRAHRDEVRVHTVPAPDELSAASADAQSRPSIAVLPFRLIGDAGAHETIADG
ncbi:MAG: transcriptional regulator, partial [Gammaproteobacteria bacterium]|nr:transcriptional regulator [Gammaproteobacteria bacterium]